MSTPGFTAQELDSMLGSVTLNPNNVVTIGAVGAPSTLSHYPPGINGSFSPLTTINPQQTQVIQGKMFTAEVKIYDSALQLPVLNKDEIRKKLADQIAEKLLQSEYIEFTQQKIVVEDAVVIRARFFAVPDASVRLIRELDIPVSKHY